MVIRGFMPWDEFANWPMERGWRPDKMTQMEGVGKQGIIVPRPIGIEAMQSLAIEPTGDGAS